MEGLRLFCALNRPHAPGYSLGSGTRSFTYIYGPLHVISSRPQLHRSVASSRMLVLNRCNLQINEHSQVTRLAAICAHLAPDGHQTGSRCAQMAANLVTCECSLIW